MFDSIPEPGPDVQALKDFQEQHPEFFKSTAKKKRKNPGKKPQWNLATFDINCGNMFARIPIVCKPLIDTPIFQTLKNKKQLGVCERVYPDANHDRFTHSICTASWALTTALQFREQKGKDGKPIITNNEALCVIVAALCHDLGHGPFSHLTEEIMVEENIDYCHERRSQDLFEKILRDYPEAKKTLKKYLNEQDFDFIKELIRPPPFHDPVTGKWQLCVSPKKAFLYSIVSNPINGLDVDKMEYLFRDSIRCGVQAHGITIDVINRIIHKMLVVNYPEKEFTWVAHPDSDYNTIRKIFNARKDMHQTVYCHKTVLAIGEMYKKAIKLAFSHVQVPDTYNNETQQWTYVSLRDAFLPGHLDAFLKLDDRILETQISYSCSTHKNMVKARRYLEDINFRRHPKLVFQLEGLKQRCHPLDIDGVKNLFDNAELFKNLIIVRKDFHGGKGLEADPMDATLFYFRSNETRFYEKSNQNYNESSIFIFAPHNCQRETINAMKLILKDYAEKNELFLNEKYRRDENEE